MNVKKGMDRIALVVAIIAIIPAFVFGGSVRYYSRNINHEFVEWKIQYTIIKLSNGSVRIGPKTIKKLAVMQAYGDDVKTTYWENAKVLKKLPPKPSPYLTPPFLDVAGVGFLASIMSFAVCFLSIRGITRLLIWIAIGFKDE